MATVNYNRAMAMKGHELRLVRSVAKFKSQYSPRNARADLICTARSQWQAPTVS
jgi:hypothetical protein